MSRRTPKTEHRKPDEVYAVILVGGKGKRLRPLSTDEKPKAFLSVTRDRKTMFRNTLERVRGLIGEDNIIVVANKSHAKLVKKDFRGIGKRNLILEPVSRNTAPAIALAAHAIKKRNGCGIMAVLPSDQYITGRNKYLAAIRSAVDFVRKKSDAIIALGIRPTSPSTQLGYIKVQSSEFRVQSICKVEKFTEKPDLETAKRFVLSGQYLWNAGAFIFRVDTLLKAVKKFSPGIYALLGKGAKHYKDMPDISIDYAVMEKTRNMYCARGAYGWDDIGSFQSLIPVLKRESRRFVLEDGKVTKIL
ncbi:MAG: mannose-1-phosphate guanylyltransferase [Candidatus Omnitrophica bacterium]|nr:mannose-1-phosphate guanylyltransferase [Candidatus Omnitrophota bacterium]